MTDAKRDDHFVREQAASYATLDPHDVTLIEGNLRLTPEERLEKLVTMVRFIEAGRAAVARARAGG